jgi:5-methylcytosine-specific restriction protein A
MLSANDLKDLCRKLACRFDLALTADFETVDGGAFPVIRPKDLERGVGFGIVVARTHRQVEASFRADSFAGGLLRRMRDADEEARALFGWIWREAANRGASVYVGLNGDPCQDFPDKRREWRRLEIDVGRRLPPGRRSLSELAENTLAAASTCLSLAISLLDIEPTGDGTEAAGMPEGARIRVEVNRYERSPANRAACLAHHGSRCFACGFDFSSFYGSVGDGYAEVHHRVPVSMMGPGYLVDPVKDLIPLCGNCHAIVHRRIPPMEVDDLRSLLVERSLLDPARPTCPASSDN